GDETREGSQPGGLFRLGTLAHLHLKLGFFRYTETKSKLYRSICVVAVHLAEAVSQGRSGGTQSLRPKYWPREQLSATAPLRNLCELAACTRAAGRGAT